MANIHTQITEPGNQWYIQKGLSCSTLEASLQATLKKKTDIFGSKYEFVKQVLTPAVQKL